MEWVPETAAADKILGEDSERIIGNATSAEEIIEELARRGCSDLTSVIKLDTCTQYPVSAGSFCDVYRGKLRDGTEVAIKALRAYDDSYRDQKKKNILIHAARELYYWSKLRHPNVLPLMGLATFQGRISLISQWITSGNLTSFLVHNPTADRLALCMDICAGLNYIHANGMIHGDVKRANILVSSSGVAMLTDFGSTTIRNVTLQFTNTWQPETSAYWAAPELLLDGAKPTQEADVYAFGITALEVLTENLSSDGEPQRAFHDVLKSGELLSRPHGIAGELWNILSPCWSQMPSDRPRMETIESQLSSYESTLAERASESGQLSEDMIETFEKQGYVDITRYLVTTHSTRPNYSGKSRDIYLGTFSDGGKVAINIILKGDNDTIDLALEKQFGILKSWLGCNHPNLSQIRGFAEFLGKPAILFSWADHRSVGAYLRLNPSANRCTMSAAICSALAYLHANDIVYAHLRGDTVLVVGEGVPMLAEPGADIFGPETTPQADKDLALTYARWTAPEVLKGKTEHTRASDVYALGMTILEIITGEIPFSELADEDIRSTVVDEKRTPQRPEKYIPVSSAQGSILWANLNACWFRSRWLRPTADALMRMMKLIRPEGLECMNEEMDVDIQDN